MVILFGVFGQVLAGTLMFVLSLFLILLVLVQRGRGGGLAGAFGGMGGQSAFGAKAGDTFTRITIGAAAVWILVCLLSVRFLGNPSASTSVFSDDGTVLTDTEDSSDESLSLDSILDGDTDAGAEGAAADSDANDTGGGDSTENESNESDNGSDPSN